jgi:hypothetical protein
LELEAIFFGERKAEIPEKSLVSQTLTTTRSDSGGKAKFFSFSLEEEILMSKSAKLELPPRHLVPLHFISGEL